MNSRPPPVPEENRSDKGVGDHADGLALHRGAAAEQGQQKGEGQEASIYQAHGKA